MRNDWSTSVSYGSESPAMGFHNELWATMEYVAKLQSSAGVKETARDDAELNAAIEACDPRKVTYDARQAESAFDRAMDRLWVMQRAAMRRWLAAHEMTNAADARDLLR